MRQQVNASLAWGAHGTLSSAMSFSFEAIAVRSCSASDMSCATTEAAALFLASAAPLARSKDATAPALTSFVMSSSLCRGEV
jgi:hypothetical protein